MSTKRLSILVFLLLILLSIRIYYSEQNRSNYVNGQEISLATTISSPPRISGNVQKITIFTESRQPIFVTLPRFPEIEYGQTVKISGPISLKVANGASTQGGSVLRKEKTIMTMYFPTIEAVKNEENPAVVLSQNIRKHVSLTFHKALPSDLASLLVGIVVGVKEEMSPAFKESLQKAGVMHVVVASGMNVVLVGGFLASIFSYFLKRQVAFACAIVGIAFYALLAGLEPPIIRASIMGSLVFVSQILGRQYFGAYGLFLAIFCMFFVDPSLLHDVGFQLSVAATSGLIAFSGRFSQMLSGFSRIPEFLRVDFATTLSAQLATLPILLVYFGSYSPFSIITNMLVLWTTPILMVLGGIAAVFSFIFEPLAKIVLYVALPFLIYFEKVVYLLSQLTTWEISSIPFISVVGYYLLLVSFVLLRSQKSKVKI